MLIKKNMYFFSTVRPTPMGMRVSGLQRCPAYIIKYFHYCNIFLLFFGIPDFQANFFFTFTKKKWPPVYKGDFYLIFFNRVLISKVSALQRVSGLRCPLYRKHRGTGREMTYCPVYRGVRFIACPSQEVELYTFSQIYHGPCLFCSKI